MLPTYWTVQVLNPVRSKMFCFLQNRPERLCRRPSLIWAPGFPGIKWPKREFDHSPPSSAEVKNEWSYASTPPVRLRGVERDNFSCTFHFTVKEHLFLAQTSRNSFLRIRLSVTDQSVSLSLGKASVFGW
jgi:hypothetical protein